MIPAYQFPSLDEENVAKRRVIVKAKKGFETEEQRAIKSGQISKSLNNIYDAILANLRLQLSTIQMATALVRTIEVNVDADVKSFFIGSLGKLAGLGSQLTILIERLTDFIRATGKTTFDISKIISLMDEVDRAYGSWETDVQRGTGLRGAINDLLIAFEDQDGSPPEIDGLFEIWEVSNFDNREALLKLQRNEYRTELESIYIPSKKKSLERQADIARGEQRTFTSKEYKLLLELKKKGLVRGDDFTDAMSIASGSSSGSSGASSGSSGTSYYAEYSDSDEEGDEEDSDSDETSMASSYNPANIFGRGLSGGTRYTIQPIIRSGYNMASHYAMPLSYH